MQIFIEPFNFSFFSVTGWGIDFDYCDSEWFALETNRDPSVGFEIAPKYCISDSFVDYEGYSISSKGFLPTVVDIMLTEQLKEWMHDNSFCKIKTVSMQVIHGPNPRPESDPRVTTSATEEKPVENLS